MVLSKRSSDRHLFEKERTVKISDRNLVRDHGAEIFAVDPQGQIRAYYSPTFKPELLAQGSKTLAQL